MWLSILEKIYKIQRFKKLASTDDIREFASIPIEKMLTHPLGNAVVKGVGDYLSWDEFKRKDWAEPELEKAWGVITATRNSSARPTPVKDKDGGVYRFSPERHERFRHEIDLEMGGSFLGVHNFGPTDKSQFIRRNLIEESIASSKLEGANTSRQAARQMLAQGRSPKDKSEQMIFNNHRTMSWIEETGKNQKLTMQMFFDLHAMIVDRTMKPELVGKVRETLNSNGRPLVITPWDDETITYVAPDKEFVEEQLPRLIAFANDQDQLPFIHPLNKAITLHFWVGLLHPFEDGNGRLARILFYWYMLRKGYWAFAYLSLSERILKSPTQYAMAYINAEQDDYDLNYFIQYNVEKLKLARKDFIAFLNGKVDENQKRIKLLKGGHGLNDRQLRILQMLDMKEIHYTSVSLYQEQISDIGYVTAVNDLKTLVQLEFLTKQKNGRNVTYLATEKLKSLFQ